MSQFFDPQSGGNQSIADHKLYAPACERNSDVLLDVFKAHMPKSGTLVEVASGTGQHAAHIAPHLAPLFWQPSDIDPEKIKSIDAWIAESDAENILPAAQLNLLEHCFHDLIMPAPLSAIAAINLIHIAPWQVAEALVQGAATALAADGVLFLYGPYRRGGEHTSPSNESFDLSLKSRDGEWGVRDLEAVTNMAVEQGFCPPTIIEMPANNLSLVFKKA